MEKNTIVGLTCKMYMSELINPGTLEISNDDAVWTV